MSHDLPAPPVTSVDVAQRAGVSQSAVSLVFGGKANGRVGKHTQEAILQAAQELGYYPNRAARSLRSGRSRLIVMAVPDVSNPYFAAVFQGAEYAARQHGYTVLLASVRNELDWQPVVFDALASQSVDGFLFFAMHPPTEAAHAALLGKALLIDTTSDPLPSLLLDVEAGMHAAMSLLLDLGHTKIAHLAAAVVADTFHLRHKAYIDALQSAALPISTTYQAWTAFTITDARQAARRLLDVPEPPTAIVCDSDVLSVGVYKAARDLHFRIPQDLSVVGFDDSIIAHLLEPELTSVAIPTGILGEQALHMLLTLLETTNIPSDERISLDLVARASTQAISACSDRSGKGKV